MVYEQKGYVFPISKFSLSNELEYDKCVFASF